jgi:hypothetical protein
MDTRAIAIAHALGRVAIGAAITVAPERATRAWIGADAARPGTQLVSTSLGARDLAIGLGAAGALRSGQGARPWVLAGALADTLDLLATVRERETVPRATGLIGVGALAASSAALGFWLAAGLD